MPEHHAEDPSSGFVPNPEPWTQSTPVAQQADDELRR
jgi:hypothetical protein